jgi:hypothetical protein
LKQPFDTIHLILFAIVAALGTALVIAGKIPAATLLMGLGAWAAPSAGGSVARLVGLSPPMPPADPGAGGAAVPFDNPPPPPPPPRPPPATAATFARMRRRALAPDSGPWVWRMNLGRLLPRAIAQRVAGAIAGVWARLPWLGVAFAIALLCACPGHITPADSAIVAAQTEEERQCVESNKPDRDAIDRCRANVRARSDAYWREHFDAGGTP